MNCIIANNSLKLPFGTKISIKQQGMVNKQFNLINGSKQNEFIAIFDENDVDFEICCDNLEFDRGIIIVLSINQKYKPFYIRPLKYSEIKALESNGRKLHLISQNTDSGRDVVEQTANKYGISSELASINSSRIRFLIIVEQCNSKILDLPFTPIDITLIGTKIQIFVKTLNGKTVTFVIGLNNTVSDLKMIITKREGIPPDQQRLIFEGRQLEDNKELVVHNIRDCADIFICLRGKGGGDSQTLNKVTDDKPDSVKDQTDSHTNSCSDRIPNASQLFSGERGVICYGEQSNQMFNKYEGFIKDNDIIVNPFVIEMRMKSRFAPI